MKRDIVETGYDASDEDSDTDSMEEEGYGSNSRPCFCCQVADTHNNNKWVNGRPPRLLNLQQTLYRLVIISTYVGFILLAVQRVNFTLINSTDKHEMAWTIAGAFVIATVPISLFQIFQHLSNFVEPKQQTHVIRMIFMVPLYAIQSWFSLRYQNLSLYTQCLREAYESYVIYAFTQYLISYMGSEEQLILKLQTKPAVLGRHMAPFCCLPPWSMGAEFLNRCKMGVLQYLGIRLVTLVLTFALEYVGLYGEGEYTVRRGFFWVTVVNCISQTWALYILILFYHATHKELISINPCGKFFSIKSVVFASWWQSLLIGLMVHQGTIGELDSHSAEMVAKGVQDLLICTEMLMAAIAFTFAFPVSDFVSPIGPAYLKEPWAAELRLQQQQQQGYHEIGCEHSGGNNPCGGGMGGKGSSSGGLMGSACSSVDGVALLKGGSGGGGDLRRGVSGSGSNHVSGCHLHHHQQGGGVGRGGSGGGGGGGGGGGEGGHSIWTALWTSCVPMDVREDFKLATHQVLEDCSCFKRGSGGGSGGGSCWPCRCKSRCGQSKTHRSSSSSMSGSGRDGSGGGRIAGGRHSSAATSSSSASGAVVVALGGAVGAGSSSGGGGTSLSRSRAGSVGGMGNAPGGSSSTLSAGGVALSSIVSSATFSSSSSSRRLLI